MRSVSQCRLRCLLSPTRSSNETARVHRSIGGLMRRARSHRQRLLTHLRPALWRGAFISAALLTVSAWAQPARADDQPNRIIIEYVPPQDPAHQSLYDWLRERH